MPSEGDQVGPYVLVRELGRGGFGTVWLAERRGSIATTHVAIKLPLNAESDLELFRREAGIWVQASGHPNVLPVIEAEVYDGQLAIVSEYAAGGSLAAWLGRFPSRVIPGAQIRTLIGGIAAGLGHLHSKGIVHRDLKPANVLLQEENPRLTDFGVARVLKATSNSYSFGGTPAYMAPEAWDGERSAASDFWPLGIILYELLVGARPFNQTELMPLFRAISASQLATPPGTAPNFARVVHRCLQKSPDQRYRSAAALLADLDPAPSPDQLATTTTTQFPASAPDSLIHKIWENLDPDLQDALALAHNQARREHKDRISTRTFFAALGRLRAGRLPSLLDLLPEGALPAPVGDDVSTHSQLLEQPPKLSTCVENALVHLGSHASPAHRLGTEDVFVDVAKFGTGPSVARLRAHGVTPGVIDQIVEQLGWQVVRR